MLRKEITLSWHPNVYVNGIIIIGPAILLFQLHKNVHLSALWVNVLNIIK